MINKNIHGLFIVLILRNFGPNRYNSIAIQNFPNFLESEMFEFEHNFPFKLEYSVQLAHLLRTIMLYRFMKNLNNCLVITMWTRIFLWSKPKILQYFLQLQQFTNTMRHARNLISTLDLHQK